MPQIHELPNSRLVLALPLIKLSTLEETTDPPLRLSFFSYQMRFFDWIISRMPSALSPHFQHQKTGFSHVYKYGRQRTTYTAK